MTDTLPKSWVKTELGDVLTQIIGGGTPSKSNSNYYLGDIPFMTVKDMNEYKPTDTKDHISPEAIEESSTKLISKDSLIVSTRMGLGKVVRCSFETAINQDLKALITGRGISKDFLGSWYKSKAQHIETLGKGTTVKGITLDVLKSLTLDLPPENEQNRIVEKIDALMARSGAAKEALDAIPTLLDQYRQSVLAAAFRGDLTKDWREKNPDTEPAETLLDRIRKERRQRWEETELAKLHAKGKEPNNDKWKAKYKDCPTPDLELNNELPAGWTWLSPDELSSDSKNSLTIGPFGSNLVKKDYRETGVPLIFVKDIRAESFGGDHTVFVTEEKARELWSHRVEPSDVLITKMGDPPGDTAIYPSNRPTGIVTADCIKFSIAAKLSSPEFVKFMLRCPSVFNQMLEITTGVAQQKMSLKRFRTIALPLPPMEEQKQILRIINRSFEVIDSVERQFCKATDRLTKLNQSILAKAFRGELVPQDPTDEPASVLLDRIRSERAALAPAKKTKKKAK